jgi:hypothetical protein
MYFVILFIFFKIGCVKAGVSELQIEKDWRFLKVHSATAASCLLGHATRDLNAFCCVLEDVNPTLVSIKVPLVTLPTRWKFVGTFCNVI